MKCGYTVDREKGGRMWTVREGSLSVIWREKRGERRRKTEDDRSRKVRREKREGEREREREKQRRKREREIKPNH